MAENNFKPWQTNILKKDLTELQLAVVKWLYQAYNFFQAERPEDLSISFPSEPQVTLPPRHNNNDDLSEPGSIAVGGGIGWLLGGPVGAAVVGSISYLLNKNIQQQDEKVANESYHQQVAKVCIAAIEDYFSDFSEQGLSTLAAYEQQAIKIIRFEIAQEPLEVSQKREELQRLINNFNQLQRELETVKIALNYQLYPEILKRSHTKREYFPQPEKFSTYSTKNPREQQRQENSTKNNYTKVEPPRQQVSPPPPPPKTSPSPRPAEVEAKFRNWELDEEIAQMKAEMRSPGFNTAKQQQTNQTKTAPKQPKTQVEKDKVVRAYNILGLSTSASVAEVKQAYRTLVKKWHPDLFVNKSQQQKQAQEKMHLINEAYTILSEKYN